MATDNTAVELAREVIKNTANFQNAVLDQYLMQVGKGERSNQFLLSMLRSIDSMKEMAEKIIYDNAEAEEWDGDENE